MTVNHDVTGSSPVGGVKRSLYLWSVGQGVKTPPFHGGNTGSNPVRTTEFLFGEVQVDWMPNPVAINRSEET